MEADTWAKLAAALHKRWQATEDTSDKNTLGGVLVRIYSGQSDVAEYLAFLREQLQDGPEKYRTNYARQLFDALLIRAGQDRPGRRKLVGCRLRALDRSSLLRLRQCLG